MYCVRGFFRLLCFALAALPCAVILSHRHFSPSVVESPQVDPDVEGYDSSLGAGEIASSSDTEAVRFLGRYCLKCHSQPSAESDIVLGRALWNDAGLQRRVADAIRSGHMPPPGQRQPEAVETEQFNNRLLSPTRTVARTGARRLNRVEYDNTVSDLLGIHCRPSEAFPADDTADGFDTIGSVLSISPTLAEKYLQAADEVIESAAGDQEVWRRLTDTPREDFIPYVQRGAPPRKNDAVKELRPQLRDEPSIRRAAEIDRAYASVQAFADRAYRRPIAHSEMQRLMRFVDEALNSGKNVKEGIKTSLKAILTSPHFLFRMEARPGQWPDDYELAGKLSYFLWSSMPDEELFRLAARGGLHEPRTLVHQVRRMLRDARSRALAVNFGGQWLQTRALDRCAPDPSLFPGFDDALREAMRLETESFIDFVIHDDRCVLELLTADYTFLNERLAGHYGISGVTGSDFRRVSLSGTARAGILTQASVLTVTSGPTRTSPVKRGKWILENIMGDPVGTPPPGVDDLKLRPAGSVSLRDRLMEHRTRAECASCHARMDPLGFALENFDAVGGWRETDRGIPIDPTGTLPDGSRFQGAEQLQALLVAQPERFLRCLTGKLLIYALGRELTPGDQLAVDRIIRHASRNGNRFSSLVIAVVRSEQFQRPFVRMGSPP